jgi:hypothetical protein
MSIWLCSICKNSKYKQVYFLYSHISKLELTGEEGAMVSFKVLSWYSLGGTEESHINRYDSQCCG